MTQIRDALIVITGAASGIGRLLSIELARRGGRVVGVDVNAEGLNAVSEEIGEAFTPEPCDLTDVEAIEALARRVEDRAGSVEILIHNAGVVGGKWLHEARAEAIERTFRVNALAPIHLTRALLPSMRRSGGHVVTVASAAGLAGAPRLVDYCASKFAAVGFDDALRLEMKRLEFPVRTTLVCPYYIDTGMFHGVKSRHPWLLPILDPEKVTGKIIRAIERNRPRLIMPPMIYTAWPTRLLPVAWFDRLMHFLGITTSMDEFRGRVRRRGSSG